MTYTNEDPVEITLGVCEQCSMYVPFVRLISNNNRRNYQCMTCKARHTQYVNGKITFNYLEDSYVIKTPRN